MTGHADGLPKDRHTRVILLNGPPNSGKDTLAAGLANHLLPYQTAVLRSFKTPLYQLASIFYGIPFDEVITLCTDRDLKDRHSDEFGCTPREALIFISETVVKPNFGDDWFGLQAVRSLAEDCINIFTDSGFEKEAMPLYEIAGRDNFLLVHVHRDGCSFEGDSRDYLPPDLGAWFTEFHNNCPLEDSASQLSQRVNSWLRSTP